MSPRHQFQQHSQPTMHTMNSSGHVSSGSFGPATIGQGHHRPGYPDHQAKNSVFSNALSCPVRRSLQHYHLAHGSYNSSNATPSANGARTSLAVFGDSSALAPGGVRIGAPAMTSRGLVEKDFEQIAEFLHQAVTLCLKIQKEHGKLLKDFNKGLVNNKDIEDLKAAVEKFSSSFDMPGFLMSEMNPKFPLDNN
ncbi:hypothetical protein Syun_006218 [Stephania yunnanensis]|uniref:Serine hydroxymethyltransferase-like domain-containing protein n=1 Tax=Stephania yunnanensis TaxID=152371 RepID=A0AAP0PXC3_9MAGN